MIPAPFDYVRAASVEEALERLGEPEAAALAGGQSLVPLMKLRVARPALLVDISRLDLGGIDAGNREVRLGALTTWAELARAGELRTPALAAIGECAACVGDLQVRNRGTLGGGLAHADPASDMPAVMLALGARLRMRSPSGDRTLGADEFFVGPFTTVLSQQELVCDVLVPTTPRGSGSAYVSVEHPASGFAVAGAAALVTLSDGQLASCSVGLTSVGGRPVLLRLATFEDLEAAVRDLPMFEDPFASTDYRRHLASWATRRALEAAAARAAKDAQ